MRKSGRDVVVRLVVVGLLRKIWQNATVTLSYGFVIAMLCNGQESVSQKMIYRIYKKITFNVRSWVLYSSLKNCLDPYKCANVAADTNK